MSAEQHGAVVNSEAEREQLEDGARDVLPVADVHHRTRIVRACANAGLSGRVAELRFLGQRVANCRLKHLSRFCQVALLPRDDLAVSRVEMHSIDRRLVAGVDDWELDALCEASLPIRACVPVRQVADQ